MGTSPKKMEIFPGTGVKISKIIETTTPDIDGKATNKLSIHIIVESTMEITLHPLPRPKEHRSTSFTGPSSSLSDLVLATQHLRTPEASTQVSTGKRHSSHLKKHQNFIFHVLAHWVFFQVSNFQNPYLMPCYNRDPYDT